MQYSVKFVKNFIVKPFKNSRHKILILSRIEKMVWVVLFWVTRLDFLKSHFKGPKYTILKNSFARKSQMWWYGRGNSGGSWLPEEKKANMWHGRGNSGGSWPPAFHRSWCSSMRDWDKALKSRILTYPNSPPRFKMDTVITVCLPDLPFMHSMMGSHSSHKGWDFNNSMKIFIIVSPKVKFGLQSLTWFFIGGLNNLTKKTKR